MLTELKLAVAQGRYNVTNHADEELVKDGLTFNDVREALGVGEVIENYPNDFPYPSCLIFGTNKKNDPIHAVWAYAVHKDIAILVTAYRPAAERWIEFRTRRKEP